MRDRMISEIVNAISFFIEDPCCLRKAKERIEGIVSKYVVSASEGAIIQYYQERYKVVKNPHWNNTPEL